MLNKNKVLMVNFILFLWFSLDMTGFSLSGKVLVSQSYKDDYIFFGIFTVCIILFLSYEKIGKYLLNIWLFMWFITQFYFHWFFTIFGPHKGKIEYFANTIKIISNDNIYIPDLYHILLHILILIAFILSTFYCYYKTKGKNANANINSQL